MFLVSVCNGDVLNECYKFKIYTLFVIFIPQILSQTYHHHHVPEELGVFPVP